MQNETLLLAAPTSPCHVGGGEPQSKVQKMDLGDVRQETGGCFNELSFRLKTIEVVSIRELVELVSLLAPTGKTLEP